MTTKILTLMLAAFVALGTTAVQAGHHGTHAKKEKAATGDIVDTAIAAGSFKTLVTAVKAAELVSTLKSDGPFTVFAPTDDAFAALPEGTLASLLEPENKAQLRQILLYHVVPGKVDSSAVVKLDSAKTAQGQSVSITVKDGKVHIDNATVIKADIETSNGVIHVIDTVILPAAGNDG